MGDGRHVGLLVEGFDLIFDFGSEVLLQNLQEHLWPDPND